MANPWDADEDVDLGAAPTVGAPKKPVGGDKVSDKKLSDLITGGKKPAGGNPWDADEEVDIGSSLDESLGSLGAGAVRGAVPAGGAVSGAFAGAALGSLVAPGPGTAVGAVIGGGAGLYGGEQLAKWLATVTMPGDDQPLTYETLEQVPLHQRPWAVAGETLGGAAAFAAVPFSMAANGLRFGYTTATGWLGKVGNFASGSLNSIIETSARLPVRFAATEVTSAISAAYGAGIAESLFPGNNWTRFGGEVIGGVLNPSKYAISGFRWAWGKAVSAFEGVDFQSIKEIPRITVDVIKGRPVKGRLPSQNELNRGLDEIVRFMTEHGEDPAAFLKAVEGSDVLKELGTKLTAAQATGNKALAALEAQMRSRSDSFDALSSQRAKDAMAAMTTAIDLLKGTGNPAALKIAAQMRADYFNILLAERMQAASEAVIAASLKIDPANPASLAQYGREAGKIMDEALDAVRIAERKLYDRVDKTTPASADAVLDAFDRISADMMPEHVAQLAPVARQVVERLRSTRSAVQEAILSGESIQDAYTTAGELIQMRNSFLELARSAAAKGDMSDARVYSKLAAATLDDMESLGPVSEAFDEARNWSRRLHETFTRTFVGDSLSTDKTGAMDIYPETLIRRAFGSGKELGDLQFEQMVQAARMGDEAFTATMEAARKAQDEFVSRITHIQDSALRSLAAQTLDPATGQVNEKALARWMRDNRAILERFPEIAENLTDAAAAQAFLARTQGGVAKARKAIENKAVFSTLVGGEDPYRVIGEALLGKNPAADLQGLAKLAERGGQQAKDGLKTAVYQVLFDQAGGQQGFSMAKYSELLEGAVYPGGPKLANVLKNSGIFSAEDILTLRQFTAAAARLEQVGAANVPAQEARLGAHPAIEALISWVGVRSAGMIPHGASSNSLLVASKMSRLATAIYNRIPGTQKMAAVEALLSDPQLMARMLKMREPKNAEEAAEAARQLNAFLWQAGVTGWDDD